MNELSELIAGGSEKIVQDAELATDFAQIGLPNFFTIQPRLQIWEGPIFDGKRTLGEPLGEPLGDDTG